MCFHPCMEPVRDGYCLIIIASLRCEVIIAQNDLTCYVTDPGPSGAAVYLTGLILSMHPCWERRIWLVGLIGQESHCVQGIGY
jgi:hypothetical protein